METIEEIVSEMRKRAGEVYAGQVGYPECWDNQMDSYEIDEIANRLEAAIKAYNQEVVNLLKSVIEGVCLHCDMRPACQEGEDGMSTHCNAVAKAKHFIEQHTEPEVNNDECPF